MFDFRAYILDVVIVVATIWIVKRFWDSFFEKKNNSVLSISVWCVFCIFQIISQWNNIDVNLGLTFTNALLILLVAMCSYQCKGKSKYFLLIIFCAVWALVEMFVFFLLSSMRLEAESLSTMGIVISTLFMMVLVYMVSVIWNKNTIISNNFYIYLLFIPIGSIYISVNQFYSKSDKASSAMITSILLLFNVIIFEIYVKMNEMFMYEKEKAVYAKQIDIMSCNTLQQKKVMEDFHEEKHNLINELIVLKEEIEKDEKEIVIRNINKIINNCHYMETISNSGNAIVDAVVNFKYAIAREYGISFNLKIFLPDKLLIEQCDMGIILGNAIDNAIEAVKECKHKEKMIEIFMRVRKETLVIVINNPFESKIKQDRGGRLLSTKKEGEKHGYGLKSIKKLAEKYQGEINIDTRNNVFSLTVILNTGKFDS